MLCCAETGQAMTCVACLVAEASKACKVLTLKCLQAELLYKKREKKIAPTGWEAFNQKALYDAYEKRTSDIPYSQEVRSHHAL